MIIVQYISLVVATAVVSLPYAHRVMGEVNIAVVAWSEAKPRLVSGWPERMGTLDLQKSASALASCSRSVGAEERTYIWAFSEVEKGIFVSSLLCV